MDLTVAPARFYPYIGSNTRSSEAKLVSPMHVTPAAIYAAATLETDYDTLRGIVVQPNSNFPFARYGYLPEWEWTFISTLPDRVSDNSTFNPLETNVLEFRAVLSYLLNPINNTGNYVFQPLPFKNSELGPIKCAFCGTRTLSANLEAIVNKQTFDLLTAAFGTSPDDPYDPFSVYSTHQMAGREDSYIINLVGCGDHAVNLRILRFLANAFRPKHTISIETILTSIIHPFYKLSLNENILFI